MRIKLIAIGKRMPDWVTQAYDDYAKRLPHDCRLELIEIGTAKRQKQTDIQRVITKEGEQMLAAIPKNCHVIALEVGGQSWSTEQLAKQFSHWQQNGQDIALLVGGPEGLAKSCLERAQQKWSLSALTLPHPLVRVVVAEQLFRAWSILNNHPYHRG